MIDPAIEQQLRNVAAAVAGARQALAAGAVLDLAGLDHAVAAACAAAQGVPRAERPALAASLVSLADGLDDLAADLARQHEAGTRQRAAAAYGERSA